MKIRVNNHTKTLMKLVTPKAGKKKGIQLMPGANLIDADALAEYLKDIEDLPAMKWLEAQVKAGKLEIVEPKPATEGDDKPAGGYGGTDALSAEGEDDDDAGAGDDLAGFTVSQASELIEEMTDLETLKRWLAVAGKKGVRDAIEKQIAAITPDPQDDDDDDDGDEGDEGATD